MVSSRNGFFHAKTRKCLFSTKLSCSKLKNAVLNPSKSFLAFKKVSARILSTVKRLFSKKRGKHRAHTLSDLGDLSNLIGSLSRTIQQYSPPSEWIMCELGVFPISFTERSFKSRQNPSADFF